MSAAKKKTERDGTASGLVASFVSGFVSILGRPNAGKSTLLNRMVGTKVAIVTDRPQTTRQVLQGVLNRPAAQVVFLDTPGIHKPDSKISQRMMREVHEALEERDLLLLLVDASQPFGPGDSFALDLVKRAKTKTFLVANKIDLLARKELLLPVLDRYQKMYEFAELVPVSARTGENVEHLVDTIVRYLPPGPQYFPPGHLTDLPARFMAAEIIREKAILLTRQELPYVTAVIVDQYEKHGGLLRLHTTIFVERDGQKGILIGAHGDRLKQIAIQAREEIEKFFDCRVYLELFIKVRPNWRESNSFLEGLDWRTMVGGEGENETL
jgi:GTP-binding protein Era